MSRQLIRKEIPGVKSNVPTWRLFNRWLSPVYNTREEDKTYTKFIIPTYIQTPKLDTFFRGRIAQPYKTLMGGDVIDFSMRVLQNMSIICKNGMNELTFVFHFEENFVSTINLSLDNAPSGVTLFPTRINITEPIPEYRKQVFLTVAPNVPLGTYELTIIGTSNNRRKTVTHTLVIIDPNFNVSINPTKSYISNSALSAITMLTIEPLQGFHGEIKVDVLNYTSNFLTISHMPIFIENISFNGRIFVPLTFTFISQPTEDEYTINLKIYNTEYNIIKELTYTIAIQSFTALISPLIDNTQINIASNPTLTIIPKNNFNGVINVTLCSPIEGINFTPLTIPITSNQPVTTSLTIIPTTSIAHQSSINIPICVSHQNLIKTLTYTLRIINYGFDLEIKDYTLPNIINIRRGETLIIKLLVKPYGGFTGNVNIKLKEPIPTDIIIPTNLIARITSTSSVLLDVPISIGNNVPLGTHYIKIVGYDDFEDVTALSTLGIRIP